MPTTLGAEGMLPNSGTSTDDNASDEPLLVATGLRRHFPLPGGLFRKSVRSVKAVDGVDLTIRAGETLGLVGRAVAGNRLLGECWCASMNPLPAR